MGETEQMTTDEAVGQILIFLTKLLLEGVILRMPINPASGHAAAKQMKHTIGESWAPCAWHQAPTLGLKSPIARGGITRNLIVMVGQV